MFIIAVSKRNLEKYTQISLISVQEHRSSTKSPVACAVVIMLLFAYLSSCGAHLARPTLRSSSDIALFTYARESSEVCAKSNLEHRMAIKWNSGELNIVCPVCTSYLLLRQEFPHGLRSIAKKVHESPAIRVTRAKLNGLCKACICRKKLRVGIYRVAGIIQSVV